MKMIARFALIICLFAASLGVTFILGKHIFFSDQSPTATPLSVLASLPPLPASLPIASLSAQTLVASAPGQVASPAAVQHVGPCATVPTLMYHHIEDLAQAKTEGHQQLTVGPAFFQAQMQYLSAHHYTVISMQRLIDFLFAGHTLPPKPILLTFDDGYNDFAQNALPILQSFHYPATEFIPTGLLENPGYMTWAQLASGAQSGLVLFSNHTWSHHNMAASNAIIQREITLAETQLAQHGYDQPKVFAYPYGLYNAQAQAFLKSQNYLIAFTTQPGTELCKDEAFALPRVRIGNASLNAYGL